MTSQDSSAAAGAARGVPERAPAAAVLLLRRAPRLEVYWIERDPLLAYLGGFHAFPGGRVGPEDAAVPVAGVDDPAEAQRRAGAVRELFEETGVLLARPAGPGPARLPDAEERAAARAALIAEDLSFTTFLREHGLVADGTALTPAGRWVSPPITPRGFDTAFYLAACPAGESPLVVPGELAGGEWIEPERAWAAWESGAVLLASPVKHGLAALRVLAREAGAPGAEAAALAAATARCGAALAALPEGRGGAIERIEMTPGVVLVPYATRTLAPATHTNGYVVGEGECLVVDPAAEDAAGEAALLGALERLAVEGRRPVAIAVTHAHRDHVGGVAALRRRLGVPVWAHPLAAGALGADRALADGERLVLAGGRGAPWRLTALFTPGHARDHVAFLEPDRGVLLAGDLVSGLSTVVLDPPEGDLEDYLSSLRRLLALPVRALFPGHGPPGGGARRRLAQLIEHRRWREGMVIGALRAGPATLAELLPRAYADASGAQRRWARRSLLAHLLALEKRGEAAREPAEDAGADADAAPADESGVWRLR